MTRRPSPLVVVFPLLAVLASAVPAAAGIYVGTPSVDPAPNLNVVAGVPVKFLVTGSFKPPDEDGSPWITFVWNFGDGTPVVSQRFDGAGAHTHELTHTFPQGGLYTVTVTGGHGFDFFGFRFAKSKKIKVKVECAGSAPSPKKCAKGTFSPFTGIWIPALFGGLDEAALQLEHLGNTVIGALSYAGPGDTLVTLPISGKAKYKIVDDLFDHPVEALVVKFKADYTVDGEEQTAKGRLVMPIADIAKAYRGIALDVENAPDPAGPGTLRLTGELWLAERTSDTTAKLCTTIAAGKKTAKPGQLLYFGIGVQNEGVASLIEKRTVLDVAVSGGTIEDVVLDRMAEASAGASAVTRILDVDPLGAGKGQKNAQAEAFIGVRVAPGAKEVAIDLKALANPNVVDPPFAVHAPPDRRICVPVVE